MSFGRALAKTDIDGVIGNAGPVLNNLFFQITQLKADLDALSDATLLAAPYSYTQTEINNLRSSYNDLNNLGLVYQGLGYVTLGLTAGLGTFHANGVSAFGYDFRTFLKLGWGLGF